ncbi:MAG: hypothetical protein H6932_17550 [Burkholderiaceae bacterium]|nr:hypothetical protein [Burkholderiaceae bacterium]
MSSRFLRGAWATTLCTAAAAAPFATVAAEPPPPRPDPTRIDAAVPPLAHRSALQRYRPLTDEPRRDWRAANAEVARIGGWRAYLREAHAPEPAASAPASSMAPAAPAAPAAPTSATPMPPHGHGHHVPGGRR